MIAIAALSARALVACAAAEGERCAALDLFGDLDTRALAACWQPIGDPATLAVDGSRLLDALSHLAADGATGWVAGSGFEGRPDLLEAGARCLPLLGTAGADVRRVRDPRQFFDFLSQAGIAHPEVRHAPPEADDGAWLLKDGAGAGGLQVQPADGRPAASPLAYWQRRRDGAVPMSATFVADGRRAVLLGVNQQQVQPLGDRPYVFRGVIGPLAVAPGLQRTLAGAATRLAAHFGLLGLCSLDFLLCGGQAEVIEVNPRPPASLGLYPRVGDAGPWRAHLRACLDRELPQPAPADAVRGIETVFAPFALRWGDAAVRRAAQGTVHDLPMAGSRFAAGDPVCTLSAAGADAAAVQAALARCRRDLLNCLEPLS